MALETSYHGHTAECLCVRCCTADMDAHVTAMGWKAPAVQALGTRHAAGGIVVAEQPVRKSTPATGASEKQMTFLASLIERKGYTEAAAGIADLTARQASNLIDILLKMADAPRPTAPAVTRTSRVELADGMYLKDGVVYKIQHAVHGSGRQYAKQLDGNTFTYAQGAITRLTAEDKMTLEQAKEYGALYGTCCVCGRTLTDEKSIEAGIGPICAGKF